MDKSKLQSVVVYNNLEFYLAVAKLAKPIVLKPLDDATWSDIVLSEMECAALLNFTNTTERCKCSDEKFPPDYPFLIQEQDSHSAN